jgi:hypothetical protein
MVERDTLVHADSQVIALADAHPLIAPGSLPSRDGVRRFPDTKMLIFPTVRSECSASSLTPVVGFMREHLVKGAP